MFRNDNLKYCWSEDQHLNLNEVTTMTDEQGMHINSLYVVTHEADTPFSCDYEDSQSSPS